MRDSSFWSVAFTRLLNVYAIVIFVILWVGFIVALLVNPEWLDMLWDWVRALPLVAEIIVWAAFLPIVVGLWIWTSAGPILLRLLGAAGIVGWTIVAIYNFIKVLRGL